MKDAWVNVSGHKKEPRFRLLCFPHAGGGAAIYKKWETVLPDFVELCALQLPGRENRIGEDLIRDMGEVIHAFHGSVFPLFDGPFAFFGHSMGALIAYEYSLYLSYEHQIEPSQLFLSGRSPPFVASEWSPIHNLSDHAFINRIRRFGDTLEEALLNEALLEFTLPALRSDFALIENHPLAKDRYLSCPITVFGGDADPHVDVRALEGWREVTVGKFSKKVYSGGHFFLNDCYGPLVKEIVENLNSFG